MAITNVTPFWPPEVATYPTPLEITDTLQWELDRLAVLQTEIGAKFTTHTDQPKVLRELGYGYILDLLDATGTPLASVVPFLAMLRHYKGTRRGIELALAITGLSVNAGAGFITEWWETTGMVPDTYKIRLEYAGGGNVPYAIFKAFRTFSREYVYPILDLGILVRSALIPRIEAMGTQRIVYVTRAQASRIPIIHAEAMGTSRRTLVTSATI